MSLPIPPRAPAPHTQRRGRTILGVDPGLTRCGLGAVTADGGRRVRIVDVGVVATDPDDAVEQRLLAVADAIDAWLDRLAPDELAVERVFAQANVSTVAGTAQVAGLAMVAGARRGIPVTLHTPSEVKAAITGNGRAGKAQVTTMVTRILELAEAPRPADAADALALAICHAWRSGTLAGTAAAAAVGHARRPAPGKAAPPLAGPGPAQRRTGRTAAQEAWLAAEAKAQRGARQVAAARPTVGR